METIWKFGLDIVDGQVLTMPRGSRPLAVAEQHGGLQLWAFIPDTTAQRVSRAIRIRGTGHDCGGAGVYIGSAVTRGGALVWHVFDGGEVEP